MNESVRSAAISPTYEAHGGGKLPLVIAAVLLAVGGGLVASYYLISPPAETPIVAAPAAAPADPGPAHAAARTFLDAPVTLRFDGRQVTTTWAALGVAVNLNEAPRAGFHPVAINRQIGLEALVGYKDSYDRPAADARIDLDNRTVIPDVKGFGIHVYASLSVLETAARAGQADVELAGGVIEPLVTKEKLGNIEIGTVMGWYETKYPVGERDRNYNLKLAAEHVNGHVMMPGDLFSFNDVVGERTEKQGYRVAHVIQAGEMIDGLAGGACQVSSTLHGAAFFAGLEIVASRPHSRPSAYVPMGMDATVVYPTTDLKLKNPYDFPVVLKYTVSQGTMRVEVLGKPRPYDKIFFEREIKKEIPYETITREDDSMPVGAQIVEQVGFPGYELIRRRLFVKDGKQVKADKWTLKYPPTTEYLRIGTNPDPNLPAPEQPKLHGPMVPGGKHFKLGQ